MKFPRVTGWPTMAVLGCGLLTAASATGCQAVIGGQTLPSPYYLEDDVQFFPAGPEFLLPNQVRALDEFKLNQAAAGLGGPLPPAAPAPPGVGMPPAGPVAPVPGGPIPPVGPPAALP